MSKQARIIREIEQSIALGRFKEGEKLPTQKELMEQFGVAVGTIQSVVEQLQSRGVIVSKRGSGTVVSDRASLEQAGILRPRVEILMLAGNQGKVDAAQSYTSMVIQEILNRHGFDLILRNHVPATRRELVHWADNLQAVIAVDFLPAMVADTLRYRHRPVVVAGELHDRPCPSGVSQVSVAMDLLPGLALSYLGGLGHRRIALVRRADAYSYYMAHIGTAFQDAIARHGGGSGGGSGGISGERFEGMQWEFEEKISGEAVIQRWQETPAQQRPTALLVEGGQKACKIIRHAMTQGIRIPGDLSICAINGQPADSLSIPHLSRVDTTPQLMGEKLAGVLLEVIRDDTIIRQMLAPQLVWGETCGRPALD